jgi:hypothetical protein
MWEFLLLAIPVTCVPLYGGMGDLGYYFTDISIGSPPQRMSVIVDTGSEGLFVACTSCDSCGSVHMDPFYNPEISSSFKVLDQCPVVSLRNPSCSFSKRYLEGSTLRGRFVSDRISIDTLSSEISLGCIECETKLFLEQKANGLVGLSPSSTNQLFFSTEGGNIKAFSLCLSPVGGEMKMFPSSSTQPEDAISLEYRDNHYVVSPSKIDIVTAEGSPLWSTNHQKETSEFLSQKTLIDSGSTVTYLNDSLFQMLTKFIDESLIGFEEDFTGSTKCWLEKAGEDIGKRLPELRLTFPYKSKEGSLTVSFKEYINDDAGKSCLTIASNQKLIRTDLGASWLINKEVTFSTSDGWIRIEEKKCPNHHLSTRDPVVPLPGQVPPPRSIRWTVLLILFTFAVFLILIVRRNFAVNSHQTPRE